MIDLTQLLREERSTRGTHTRERRASERHDLKAIPGEFSYRGVLAPCQILNISMGGCCISTQNYFAAGALAHVEVILPIFGMVLRNVGTTQWVDEENRIGIRFLHPSARSKNQLASLISCLIDRTAEEAVKQALAPADPQPDTIEMPALEPSGNSLEDQQARALSEGEVHGGARKVQSQKVGEWPATLRSPQQQVNLSGALLDLSLTGCSVRTVKSFTGKLQEGVEVEFEICGLPFRLGGVIRATYDAHSVGVQFIPLTNRKRAELEQAIEELGSSSMTANSAPAHKPAPLPEPTQPLPSWNDTTKKKIHDDWDL